MHQVRFDNWLVIMEVILEVTGLLSVILLILANATICISFHLDVLDSMLSYLLPTLGIVVRHLPVLVEHLILHLAVIVVYDLLSDALVEHFGRLRGRLVLAVYRAQLILPILLQWRGQVDRVLPVLIVVVRRLFAQQVVVLLRRRLVMLY